MDFKENINELITNKLSKFNLFKLLINYQINWREHEDHLNIGIKLKANISQETFDELAKEIWKLQNQLIKHRICDDGGTAYEMYGRKTTDDEFELYSGLDTLIYIDLDFKPIY